MEACRAHTGVSGLRNNSANYNDAVIVSSEKCTIRLATELGVCARIQANKRIFYGQIDSICFIGQQQQSNLHSQISSGCATHNQIVGSDSPSIQMSQLRGESFAR